MKKNKKGFTLIELLAVIVILAIIALIATPIVLNMINNARKKAAESSAYGFVEAIEYNNGLADISNDMNLSYEKVIGNDLDVTTINVKLKGKRPTSGTVSIDETGKVTEGDFCIEGYQVTYRGKEVTEVKKGCSGSSNGGSGNNGSGSGTSGNSGDNGEIGDGGVPCSGPNCSNPTPSQVTYKCKKATSLHNETCSNTSGYCWSAGYFVDDGVGHGNIVSKNTTTITYGKIPGGSLVAGNAYNCDVNGDGTYDPATERFYYVSDYYDTSTKSFNNDYAVLVYYSNVTNGVASNTTNSTYDTSNYTKDGPGAAKTQLPTTSQWSNVSLYKTTRAILNQEGNGTTANGNWELTSSFSYEGYAARLLTAQELNSACGITVGGYSTGELDSCNYLMENTKYSNPSISVSGSWIETARSDAPNQSWWISSNQRYVDLSGTSAGVRPVIEVAKTDIEQ